MEAQEANQQDQLLLQQAKHCFMANSVKTNKLLHLLTKCLLLLLNANPISRQQATDLFFHTTRLLQYKHKDTTLIRLTHLTLKLLAGQADNVFVVLPSLTGHLLNEKQDLSVKVSALRALCHLSDNPSTLEPILLQALKQQQHQHQPSLCSAAISALKRFAIHQRPISQPLANHLHETLNSDWPMLQYHSLGALYTLCNSQSDQLTDLITKSIQRDLKAPLPLTLLIRLIYKRLSQQQQLDPNDSVSKNFLAFIRDKLEHSGCEMVEYEAASSLIQLQCISSESRDRKVAVAHMRNFLTSPKAALRFSALRCLNELTINRPEASNLRFWSIHRIGTVCKLHLLNKRYKPGDQIIGILDFSNSNTSCAKYTVILQCEENQLHDVKQEFSLGLDKSDFVITIPLVDCKELVLHCVLSFLFYITDKNYQKTLHEDRVGTIELGPGELDTKLFSCDFPIAVHT